MPLLLLLIETLLQLFAGWTLAYHLCLALNRPAEWMWLPFALCSAIFVAPTLRRWPRVLRQPPAEWRFLVAIAAMAAALAAFELVNNRPNSDDYFYFHRALYQLRFLDQPFFRVHTGYDIPNLPPFSLSHIMTAYEPLVAMGAAALHLDPLSAYHNVTVAVGAVLLVAVYAMLYRQARLQPRTALACTAAMLAFLWLDVVSDRGFGTTLLMRLWQGKVLLWGVLTPLTLLLAWRFLSRPLPERFYPLALASLGGAGLSGSAYFMLPFLVAGCAGAYLLAYGFQRRRLKRALLLALAVAYPAGLALAFFLGIFPEPVDVSVWRVGWPPIYSHNLGLVLGGESEYYRNVFLLLVVPFLALIRPVNRFPVLLSVVLCILFANPVTGPWWIGRIPRAVFWRAAYLFPVPFCGGLIYRAVTWRAGRRRTRLLPEFTWRGRKFTRRRIDTGLAFFALALVLFAALDELPPNIVPRDLSRFKPPGEYRFCADDLEFSRRIGPLVRNRSVLAPGEFSCALGLIEPSIRFIATRPDNTRHTFLNAHLAEEGEQRIKGQALLSDTRATDLFEPGFLHCARHGLQAAVFKDEGTFTDHLLARELPQMPGHWVPAVRSNGYLLLLRR